MLAGPEIAIMTKFFNEETKNFKIIKVKQNKLSKNSTDISVLNSKKWNIDFKSRGSELIINFYDT